MIREIVLTLLMATSAFAETANESTGIPHRLSSLIRTSLTEKIAGSEIKIPSLQKLFSHPPMSDFTEIKTVRLIEDKTNGIAVFEVEGTTADQSELKEVIQTPYEAWKKVPVAIRRIYPNSRLKNTDFKIDTVNVASGLAREYRGVMLPPETKFDSLQSKQTILENQYVVSSAIERQPDVKRGETVKLELISGDLTLTTQAEVQEPALIGDRVKVITVKTKKELTGLVKEDHTVEVVL